MSGVDSVKMPCRQNIESRERGTSITLFDPDYKVNSGQSQGSSDPGEESVPKGMPQKVDIDKMHLYRDAIRDSSLGRVVRYAAILYPGTEVHYADGIEALHACFGKMEEPKARLHDVIDRCAFLRCSNYACSSRF